MWSDRDQSASDRDQRSADDDQRASDDDLEAGGDAGVHKRSASARAQAGRDRENVTRLRDETSRARLEAAARLDRAAELRDRGAEGRDLQARMRELRHDDAAGAGDILLRAGRDRAKAADDRAKAAEDRARAAADREAAASSDAAALQAQAKAQHDAQHNLLRVATDELTGAWTREFGLARVSHEIDRASRTDGTLVLVVIDVDGLKEDNDTLGRADTNRLLRFVGDTLKANMRSYDVIVRNRDDGFLCAMPSVSRRAATERLATVAALLTTADTKHAITFGLAEYEPADELEELVGRADADLLAARGASGRE